MEVRTEKTEVVPGNYRLLIPGYEIRERISELGEEIAGDFKDSKPIMIGVLNGGFIFLADLIRNMPIDLEIDFIRISSYGNEKESTGHIKVLKPLSADITGRPVVVVEDIVDSGLSIKFLENMLSAFKPSTLKFATLLNKPSKNQIDIPVDYIGFDIGDNFVVGYGLDDNQFKRNLKSIYFIK